MRPVAAFLLGIGTLAGAAQAATPAEQLIGARAAAGRCDLAGALGGAEAALSALRRTNGAEGLMLIAAQDVATYANGLGDAARAETAAREAVAIAERAKGRDSADWALVGQNLAVALAARDRRAEARTLFAEITRTAAGRAGSAVAANAEIGFAKLELGAGSPSTALDHAARAVTLAADPSVPPRTRGEAALLLADVNRRLLRFADAETAADTAAGIGENGARLLLLRAAIAYESGRFRRALDLLDEIGRRFGKADPCDPLLAVDVAHRRGTVHMLRREVPEARLAFTQALAALAASGRPGGARRAEIGYGLAVAAAQAGDVAAASALFDRAAADFRAAYGQASLAEVQVMQERALMFVGVDRAADAVAAARAAILLLDAVPDRTAIDIAYARVTLGRALALAGDAGPAGVEIRAAFAAFETARGRRSFDLAPGLVDLGDLELARGRGADAQPLYRRALAIQKRWNGESAILTGRTLAQLAQAQAAQGERNGALRTSADAVAILRRRLALGETRPWADLAEEKRAARTIVEQDAALALAPLAPLEPGVDGAIAERVAEDAQLANAARTGSAIAQLAQRLQEGGNNTPLAADLRRRNELADEWRAIQDALVGGLQADAADDMATTAYVARQETIFAQLRDLDASLLARNPKIELVTRSRVVPVKAVQAVLAPNEAALIFLIGRRGSQTVLATRDRIVVARSGLTADAVRDAVLSLRRGLDPTRWGANELPPLDTAAAHLLYRELIEPVTRGLTGIDTLLVSTDGPLASLPLSILLTEPAPASPEPDYGKLAWLVRRYAVATYPTFASIVALRSTAASPNGQSFLGVGDPVFRSGQTPSPKARLPDVGALGTIVRRLADPAMLNTMPPLPDTRIELTRMAGLLKAPETSLLFGQAATERAVRRMDLTGFGTIAFATHGLVAGALDGYSEPALALTPPATASEEDDGLLAASEVAALDLRARFVILSACNTAASDGQPNAEPLSGLARAFFYAGARSLLVSHWPVDSEATARLTTSVIAARTSGLEPAQAVRAAELDFIEDRDRSLRTHPFFWAPFELIGG